MFAITKVYEHKFIFPLSDSSINEVLVFIEGRLRENKVKKITTRKNTIEFDCTAFRFDNWNAFASVTSGVVGFENNNSTILYGISYMRLFLQALGAAFFIFIGIAVGPGIAGFKGESVLVGIIFFIILYGMNRLISVSMQNIFFRKLIKDIEAQFSERIHDSV